VEFLEVWSESVDFLEAEFRLIERPHNVQGIERSAARERGSGHKSSPPD
jgi:hypothetical protein